jgi:hypothetical protein
MFDNKKEFVNMFDNKKEFVNMFDNKKEFVFVEPKIEISWKVSKDESWDDHVLNCSIKLLKILDLLFNNKKI